MKKIKFNEIMRELNSSCYFCAFELSLHLHHIIRKIDKGLDETDNLISICPNCHALIHYGDYYMLFSRGFYYLRHRQTNHIISPNKSQLEYKRKPPYDSIDSASRNNKIAIEQE